MNGRIPVALSIVFGTDSLDFLQRMSTNDILILGENKGITTIFTTAKGKIIDVVDLYRYGEVLYVLHSAGTEGSLAEIFDKYVILEDVKFARGEHQLLFYPSDAPRNMEVHQTIDGALAFSAPRVLKAGYAIAYPVGVEIASDKKPQSITYEDFESIRLASGIPLYPHEINDQVNPFEAGLLQYVSWTKGCYIGQEVIARLDSSGRNKRFLTGFRFDGHVAAESGIDVLNRGRLFAGEELLNYQFTSVGYSDSMKASIGFLRIEKKNLSAGSPITLETEKGLLTGEISNFPS